MSMLNRPVNSTDTGETIASTRDYEVAQKTVSKLIAAEIPARDIAIVGQGVRTVERITGRLGYATAARSGAINGVLIGLFLSAILVIGNPEVPIQLFLGCVLIGVAIGMILSLVTFAIVRRRRDFASVTQLAADHYEVTVLPSSLAKARTALGAAARPEATRPPVDLSEPPRYGERLPQGAPVPGQNPQPPAEPVIPPRPADPVVPGTDVPAAPQQPESAAPQPAEPGNDPSRPEHDESTTRAPGSPEPA